MNTRTLIIAGLVLLAVGYATGRMTTKAKVEVQTVTQIKEVKKQNIAQNIHSKTVEEVKPDGSKTTTTVTDTSTNTAIIAKSNTDTKSDSVTTYAQPSVTLGVAGMVDITNPSKISPGVFAVAPILGPINLQASAFLNGNVTLGIGLKF